MSEILTHVAGSDYFLAEKLGPAMLDGLPQDLESRCVSRAEFGQSYAGQFGGLCVTILTRGGRSPGRTPEAIPPRRIAAAAGKRPPGRKPP